MALVDTDDAEPPILTGVDAVVFAELLARYSRGLRGANRLRAIATELRVSRLYAARRTAKAHTALRQRSPALRPAFARP